MILGIDPGLASCGWALVDEEENLHSNGCITTEPDLSLAERLYKIYNLVRSLCREYEVDKMAVEALFFAKNTKTALKVAQAVGAVKVAAQSCQVEVFEYTPLQIKMALTGYGKAEKEQVIAMVKQAISNHQELADDHAADAAGAALTHLYTLNKPDLLWLVV